MQRKWKVSNRVASTLPPIMQEMKDLAAGRDVISLAQGVPYFDPPEDSMRAALEDVGGLHRYGPDGGDPELKEEIAGKLERDNGASVDPDGGLMVTSGANLGFFNAAAAVCDPGDEMMLLDPFYFNHRMTLDILGIEAVHVSTDENYIPDPDVILKKIGPGTKALVVVSPNNPTGMVYPRKIMEEIAELCNDKGIFLISDETYEGYEYEQGHVCPLSFGPDLPIISLFSFSKNYALSGWRVGYMVFPPELYDGLLKVQDTTVICPSRISQRAALHCLRDHPDFITGHLDGLDRSRKDIIAWLRKHSEVLSCPEPDGAYYALPGLRDADRFKDSMEVVKDVLDETEVLLVPGTPFGRRAPPHFRISYGNIPRADLKQALERLDAYFEAL